MTGKPINLVLVLGTLASLVLCPATSAQGAFQNLNFESVILPLVPDERGKLPTVTAIPGWTAYFIGSPSAEIWFNGATHGDASVVLQDANSPFKPIQGKYSLTLQGSNFGFTSAAVGQVGQVPATAMSLRFLGSMSLEVTFAGHPLALVKTGSGLNYDTIATDISEFAGQSGELRFTAPDIPVYNILYLDGIRFSVAPIPEPSTLGLFSLGALLLGGGCLWAKRTE